MRCGMSRGCLDKEKENIRRKRKRKIHTHRKEKKKMDKITYNKVHGKQKLVD